MNDETLINVTPKGVKALPLYIPGKQIKLNETIKVNSSNE